MRRLIDWVNARYFGAPAGAFAAPRDLRPLAPGERDATRAFHEAYYMAWASGGRATIDLSWFGHRTLKCPLDLWTYQEIIVETRPDLIVECGTRFGGSALYLASLCQLARRGRVITIDIEDVPGRPRHRLIEYVPGSSTDPAIVARVTAAGRGKRTMVILDSDHGLQHVREEIRLYHPLVTPGCYLVVEDTNVNGHPVLPSFGPGPMEAVDEFLATRDDFAIDSDRERFMMTLNPRGYLRKLR